LAYLVLTEEEIGELERQIKQHISQNSNLKEQSELLQTIPGIGARTANLLLSEIEARALQFGSFNRGASRSDAEKKTIGNEFEEDEFIEIRERTVEEGALFSGNRGAST